MTEFGFGFIQDPPDINDFQLLRFLPPLTEALPTSYSLREQQSPVKSQGRLGSCVTFGCNGMKEYWDIKELGHTIDLSEQDLYTRCKETDGMSEEGTYPRAALEILLKEGVCEETFWPYEGRYPGVKLPIDGWKENALQYRIKSYAFVSNNLDEMKRALVQNGPVGIGIKAYQNIYSIGRDGVVLSPVGELLGGHFMVMVGYDDTKARITVKNSWGDYGDNGYLHIPYSVWEKIKLGTCCTMVDMLQFVKPWSDWPDNNIVEAQYVYNQGIFKGFPDSSFHPWDNMTVRHVSLVAESLKWTVIKGGTTNYDVATRGWIHEIYPFLQFQEERWTEPITRFQFVLLIYRHFNQK